MVSYMCFQLSKIFVTNNMNTLCHRLSTSDNFLNFNGSSKFNLAHNFCRYICNGRSTYVKGKHGKTLLAVGSMTGVAVGLTVMGRRWFPMLDVAYASTSIKFRPEFVPTRQVKNCSDGPGLRLTLFQFQTCPFCCKVRSVLDYYGLSYDLVEVNCVTKKEIKWSDYKKVPIVFIDGVDDHDFIKLIDSSVIISILESLKFDQKQSLKNLIECYECMEREEKGKKVFDFPNKYFLMHGDSRDTSGLRQQELEEGKWRKWTDDHLVHILSPNAYRTPSESLQTFRYFSDVGGWQKTFSTAERMLAVYVGATAMYFLGKVLKKRYKLKDDVRESLYDACKEWTEAVGPDRLFMGKDAPNLADLAVYGVLSSIEGCLAFKDAQAHTDIGAWYQRVKKAVSSHDGAPAFQSPSMPQSP